ncbi:MAG: zinc ABC transporter substrate-binding protein [Elusimicrobia bacterium]|nr:zinc ABC transporter substrate-binding protein [Elusimicrobiota bacterium]
MKKIFIYVICEIASLTLAMTFLCNLCSAKGRINVVTSTEDLADLIKVVGGEKVNVVSLSKGSQDPHYVEPRPSMVILLKKADMVVRIGMDLDIWVDSLIAASRNSRIIYGAVGYVDTSVGLERLEIPTGKIDGSMGDIHIYGNPHYWLDPENAKVITKNVLNGLAKLSRGAPTYFENNRTEYLKKLEAKINALQEKLKPYKGTKIVTYHNSWPYFAKRFGLGIVGFVEPKPGIPPNPSHIAALIEKMKKEKVKIIVVEPYFSQKAPKTIASETGTKIVILLPSVDEKKGIKTFIDLFEYNINKLIDALKLQSAN